MPKTNALYGYGGFGKEVMPILKNLYPDDRNIFVVHNICQTPVLYVGSLLGAGLFLIVIIHGVLIVIKK